MTRKKRIPDDNRMELELMLPKGDGEVGVFRHLEKTKKVSLEGLEGRLLEWNASEGEEVEASCSDSRAGSILQAGDDLGGVGGVLGSTVAQLSVLAAAKRKDGAFL